jgi:hypothetical protein
MIDFTEDPTPVTRQLVPEEQRKCQPAKTPLYRHKTTAHSLNLLAR